MSLREPIFMKELHEIRKKHYEATKNLSPQELVRKIHQEAENFLKGHGYKFVPTERGTLKIVKISEKVSQTT